MAGHGTAFMSAPPAYARTSLSWISDPHRRGLTRIKVWQGPRRRRYGSRQFPLPEQNRENCGVVSDQTLTLRAGPAGIARASFLNNVVAGFFACFGRPVMVLKNAFIAITGARSWDAAARRAPTSLSSRPVSWPRPFPGRYFRRSGSGLRRRIRSGSPWRRGAVSRTRACGPGPKPAAEPPASNARVQALSFCTVEEPPVRADETRLHAGQPRAAGRTKLAHRHGNPLDAPASRIRGFRSGPAGRAVSATGSANPESRAV